MINSLVFVENKRFSPKARRIYEENGEFKETKKFP